MKRTFPLLLVLCTALSFAHTRHEKPLYDRLGGVHPIAAVVDDFVNRLLTDTAIVGPLLQHVKVDPEQMKMRVPGLKYLVTEQICQVTGGPQKYSGGKMRDVHQGMMIDDSQWQAMAVDLKASFDKFSVPDSMQKELFTLLGTTKKDIVTGDSKQKMTPTMKVGPNSKLYDRLGGVYGIAALSDVFIDDLLKDPTIGSNPKVVASLGHITAPGIKFLLTSQICALSGGPQKYAGRSMKEAHKDLMISENEWESSGKIFIQAMEKMKIGKHEQDELLALVASTKKDIVKK
jgi:hemoglobin